jgi:hypothetical protein
VHQDIVGSADDSALGTHLVDAAQQELPEVACLFDLPQHRLEAAVCAAGRGSRIRQP